MELTTAQEEREGIINTLLGSLDILLRVWIGA